MKNPIQPLMKDANGVVRFKGNPFSPQPDRTAELEAALKVARDALNDCEGALDECRDYPITYNAIIEAIAKINEVLHD